MNRIILLFVLIVFVLVINHESVRAESELEAWCKAKGQNWSQGICTIGELVSTKAGTTLTISDEESLLNNGNIISNAIVINYGTIVNNGIINHSIFGEIINYGTIINNQDFHNSDYSTIFNFGTIDNFDFIQNHGAIDNFDFIINHGTIENYDTINNLCGGRIYPIGKIINEGTINNIECLPRAFIPMVIR